MKKIRKGATHGLKAVGGSFMDADLKVHIKNRKLEQTEIMSRIFFKSAYMVVVCCVEKLDESKNQTG